MLIFNKLLEYFILPKSKLSDEARSEFILNILLVGSITLALVAFFGNIISYLTTSSESMTINAISPYISFCFLLFFCIFLFLSRKGKVKLASISLILFFTLSSFYTSWRWGIDIPQALLLNVFVIIMSGILIGTRFAFFMTALICLYIFSLAILHVNNMYSPSLYWRNLTIDLVDTSIIITNLVLIALISWLFNREMERALLRAKYSEAVLIRQRDKLEEIVADRTQELKKAQVEKLMQLYRFAEFGRLSSGLFHELVTPLNLISLNLQQVRASNIDPEIREKFDKSLERALLGTARIERYLKAARKQIQTQDVCEEFFVNEEIVSVIQMLEYKAKSQRVKIVFRAKQKIALFGNSLKLNQVITNLVANGIDAYDNLDDRKDKRIEIVMRKVRNRVVISVEDWGCGIDKNDLPKIFDPLFTTKSLDKGTGIGLSVSKDITKNYFKGSIFVKSTKDAGAKFTISIPIPKKNVYRLKTKKKAV